MDEETKNIINHAIEESGFPFENFASTKLREHGWTIIPNRFYLDDVKGIEREIDILAYKSSLDEKERICYYTGLIISCKKSVKNKWCFLTRDSGSKDINVNYFPFHFLTDDERLKYMTYSEMALIEKKYKADKQINKLFSFPRSIISYQILNEKSFAKNEAIYDSIVTSIKALESEKSNLLKKRRGPTENYKRYYSFYLLSLFEGEMIECLFDSDGKISYSNIETIHYLNRHIVNKEENFYFVHFISKNVLDKILLSYDSLATLNYNIFSRFIDSFYKDIFKSDEKVKLLWDSFVNKTTVALSISASDCLPKDKEIDLKISYYNYKDGILTLNLGWYDGVGMVKVYDKLNEKDSYAYRTTKRELKNLFRYEGQFKFEDILPF